MVPCSYQSGLGLLFIVFCVQAASHRIAQPVNFYYGNSGPGDLQVAAAEIQEDTQPFLAPLPLVFEVGGSAPSAAGSEIVEKIVQQPKGFVPKPSEDSKTAESLIQQFEEKLKKGATIADAPTIVADPPVAASNPQKRQVKTKSTLQSSPIVVLEESPSNYARRVHKMDPVVPQLAQDSEQHHARVAAPRGVVKKRRGNGQDGKAAESKVQEQQAQGSDHHDDKHEKNEKHEHGGGKKHHDEHHGVHGEKGHKTYKGHHDYGKVEHGHHDKEGHKGHYVDEGGHKKKHHDEHDHYGEHHEGEEGDKGAKVNELFCF